MRGDSMRSSSVFFFPVFLFCVFLIIFVRKEFDNSWAKQAHIQMGLNGMPKPGERRRNEKNILIINEANEIKFKQRQSKKLHFEILEHILGWWRCDRVWKKGCSRSAWQSNRLFQRILAIISIFDHINWFTVMLQITLVSVLRSSGNWPDNNWMIPLDMNYVSIVAEASFLLLFNSEVPQNVPPYWAQAERHWILAIFRMEFYTYFVLAQKNNNNSNKQSEGKENKHFERDWYLWYWEL